MDKCVQSFFAFLSVNFLLFAAIYHLSRDLHPWLTMLQVLLPILVWELLLTATFIPEILEPLVGDYDTGRTAAYTINGRRMRSSGDCSSWAWQNAFWDLGDLPVEAASD